MTKNYKGLLIFINFIILILAIYWYFENKEKEPLIVILGQITGLVVLIFERKVSQILTKKVEEESDVNIDVQSGDIVETTDIKKSKVTIKTRK